MTMQMEEKPMKMPPYHSEMRQKLDIILVVNVINGRRQSMTMQMEEEPMKNSPVSIWN